MEENFVMFRRMLRRKEVELITGLSKSTLYARMHATNGLPFPKAVRISIRAVAWPSEKVFEYLKKIGGTDGASEGGA